MCWGSTLKSFGMRPLVSDHHLDLLTNEKLFSMVYLSSGLFFFSGFFWVFFHLEKVTQFYLELISCDHL